MKREEIRRRIDELLVAGFKRGSGRPSVELTDLFYSLQDELVREALPEGDVDTGDVPQSALTGYINGWNECRNYILKKI